MNSLEDFSWTFGDQEYAELSQFVDAFTEYNQELMDIEAPIEDFPLSTSSTVVLIFKGIEEDGEEYEEMKTTLRSKDLTPLMFLEFMYLANNALYKYLVDADHIYFEGLDFEGNIEGTPVFRLVQGS